ncbi:hypothetical protein [Euzebya tangerina]|uniref:hypothetical protein n=1 Tax=Euzebya tangerina TaxID=591198 RepID=UPI000E320D76|nr:hypothetical protein [Euzebya tangerina]
MNTPPLLPPADTPPLRTAVDVHRQWAALMGELGFADRCLWLMLLDRDGRPQPVLPRFEELPALPDGMIPRNLAIVCRNLMETEEMPVARVAFLLSRPGRGEITTSDQAWAEALEAAAASAGVPMWPVHIAGDDRIVVYDLPAAA